MPSNCVWYQGEVERGQGPSVTLPLHPSTVVLDGAGPRTRPLLHLPIPIPMPTPYALSLSPCSR